MTFPPFLSRRSLARERAPGAVSAYGAALLVGLALLWAMMPLSAITGEGGIWRAPAGDIAQTLAGHLAFQQDSWRIPPLFAETLFWPHGVSVTLTDPNPLFSLIAKLLPGGPRNLLGLWLALCWVLQPVAAVYALRAVTPSRAGAAAVAMLAALFPALFWRVHHVNLCGHFLVLAALGLALRLVELQTRRRWIAACTLLTVAVLCHPYLYMLAAIVLVAAPVQASIRRAPGWPVDWVRWAVAASVPVLILFALSGTLGGGDKGFVTYSMNLLSPFWPQRSGLFGPNLPIIDATGGQYEGFSYLGAGILLLLLAALPRIGALRRWSGPVLVLLALTFLALSSRVFAGHWKLVDLGAKPWEDVFSVFRASGRAFWPVAYALLIGGVAAACRLPAPARLALLAGAVALQLIDTAPLRRGAAAAMAGADAAALPLPALPHDATLLTVLPAPGCTADAGARAVTNPMLLAGVRAGMQLGDIGLGRSPVWFNCESVLSDGLELPLLPRELRVFADPASRRLLRPALLGADASCRETEGALLCGRGVTWPDRMAPPLPAGPPPPQLTAGSRLAGDALAPALGFGWRRDADGAFWSEGPRASLVLSVPPGRSLVLALDAAGIAQRAGGTREVSMSANRKKLGARELPDGETRTIGISVPGSTVPDGVLRLAFDVFRPIDPARRGLAAPVQRAAIRLLAVGLTASQQ